MKPPALQDPRPSITTLLRDPAVRHPLKSVLRAWTQRDPVDAAEDAGLLALAFERRADEAVCRTPRLRPSVEGGLSDE